METGVVKFIHNITYFIFALVWIGSPKRSQSKSWCVKMIFAMFHITTAKI